VAWATAPFRPVIGGYDENHWRGQAWKAEYLDLMKKKIETADDRTAAP
jgi:hypothetical protein